MPADLDLLNAFTEAISGEHVQLPSARGVLTVPKAEFELAFRELAVLRLAQDGQDEGAEQAQGVVERLVDLLNMAEEQQAAAIPVEMLTELFEAEQPKQLDTEVGLVTELLQSLGVDAGPETGAAFLDALATHRGEQPEPGRHRALEVEEDEPDVQQLFQAVTQPAARAVLKPRLSAGVRLAPPRRPVAPRGMLPPNGIPIPATPTVDPNKNPITAEQLFGLRRSANGRYDAGSLES